MSLGVAHDIAERLGVKDGVTLGVSLGLLSKADDNGLLVAPEVGCKLGLELDLCSTDKGVSLGPALGCNTCRLLLKQHKEARLVGTRGGSPGS